jgi:hypothetical protein
VRCYYLDCLFIYLTNKQTLSDTLVEVLGQFPPIALIYELSINMGLHIECSSMQPVVANFLKGMSPAGSSPLRH